MANYTSYHVQSSMKVDLITAETIHRKCVVDQCIVNRALNDLRGFVVDFQLFIGCSFSCYEINGSVTLMQLVVISLNAIKS